MERSNILADLCVAKCEFLNGNSVDFDDGCFVENCNSRKV